MRQQEVRKVTRRVRAAIIVGFDQAVRELGGDPISVQQTAGVQLKQLVDPNTLISAQLATNVLNLSAKETHCEHFGLEFAKRRNLSGYLGILDGIMQAAPTLGNALAEVFELFSIHSEASLWQLRTSGDVSYILFYISRGSIRLSGELSSESCMNWRPARQNC
jgi:hypothetical protein